MKFAVLGAGNGGQAISGWLAMQGHEVWLYEIVKDKVDEQPNFEDFIDEDNIKDNYSCENSEEEKY